MKWYEHLYWRIVGYVEVNVKWPSGKIIIGHYDPRWVDPGGGRRVMFESADPNDHYRPYLEEYIGRQNWDWTWYLSLHGRNIETGKHNGRLTIRIRKKHAIYATHIAMRWA